MKTIPTSVEAGFSRPLVRLKADPTFMKIILACVVATAAPALAAAQVAGPTLVLPFERAGAESPLAWIAEGAAVLLADDLNGLGANALTRPERVDAFEQLGLPVSASLSRATIIKVGQLVGAGEVVVGSFDARDGTLTVRARTIDIEAGRLRPELVESGPLASLFAVFDRVARRLAGVPIDPAAASRAERVSPPVEAFENYVKGLVAGTLVTQAKFLERALEIHPAYDRASLALWSVRSEQGDHVAALAAARGVTSGPALSRTARFDAALSLIELARYDEAFAELSALAQDQPAPALYNDLGVIQLRRGGTPQAGLPTYFFTKAADAEPSAPHYAFNVGYAYAVRQDMEAARYWLREAVRRSPADADAHYVLGLALEATGSRTEAARERALAGQLSAGYEQADPGDGRPGVVPRGLERVKRTLETMRADEVDAAILGTQQREQDELARFHLDRGRRLVEQERDRDAIVELRRAIYLSPYLADAHLLLGRAYARSSRTREAIDAFKIAIWSQETAEARLALARAYLQMDDEAAARAEAERALALDPASSEAKKLLEQIGRRGGRSSLKGGAS